MSDSEEYDLEGHLLYTTPETCQVQINDGNKPKMLKDNNGIINYNCKNTTVADIKNALIDLEGKEVKRLSNTSYDLTKVSFFGPMPMKDDDTLDKYVNDIGIVSITVQWHLNGGSYDEKIDINNIDKEKFFSWKNPLINKNRILNKNKNIKWPLSKEKCIISKECNSNNIYMSCKHTINPNSLFNLMLATFINTKYEHRIMCPKVKCRKVWKYKICALICSLTQKERDFFESEIINRTSPMKKCPHCNKFCKRPTDLRYYRVACPCNKGSNWCYECGKLWKGGGMTVCGNKYCRTNQINKILQNCGTITKGKAKDLKFDVPKLRACPKCYSFASNSQKCKHMKCQSCGNYFCLVCLKSATIKNGYPSWNCDNNNSAYGNCGVAPIQIVK